MTEQIITRAEAIEKGLESYFTGKPCVNGHIAMRKTFRRHCRDCITEEAKKRYHRNPQKHLQQAKNWKKNNRQKLADYRKKSRSLIPKERRILMAKETYKRNASAFRARSTAWRKANPLKVKAINAARRVRLKGNGGKFTAKQILDLEHRQRHKCANCPKSIKKFYHIDHIMPVALGGSGDIKNIQLLCPPCNLAKNAMHPADWARANGRLI